MDRVCRVLLALALVAPALTAPGPVPTRLSVYQEADGSKTTKTADKSSKTPKTSKTSKDAHAASIDSLAIQQPTPTPADTPSLAFGADLASSPVELFSRKSKDERHEPSLVLCTPGDRVCHYTLNEILVCNDYQQWTTYSRCEQGTFCHRLHMVCVPEINASELALDLDSHDNDDHGSHKCKAGDRRCSDKFNRVDRCNEQKDWVTYHDCRKAEFCDDTLLECLPFSSDNETSTETI